MLEDLQVKITRLISLYESEKKRAESLDVQLSESKASLVSCKTQIAELKAQIENQRLLGAFNAGGKYGAKESLTSLIREIDKCISLMEKD